MKKIFTLPIALLLFHACVNAQILYFDGCKVPCNVCKPDPIKVEYKADPSKQIVLRIIDEKDVVFVSDCQVLDKNNWACDGYGEMKNYGKQYAANGIAYLNDFQPIPENDKKYGKNYHCTYDKNIFGQFKLRQ